jgi:hypothetical protein
MDERLSKALEFSNYRLTLNTQHLALKAKTQNLLTYSINGGTFVIDLSLITFCKQLTDGGKTDVVLLDIYQNPILIQVPDFYDEILSRYFEVTNDYYTEYEKLKKARKLSRILDLDV